MWKCEKCGREFKNQNQDHYCGKVETIDQYISEQSEEVQPILHKVRETIRKAAPEATEKISWSMPTFWQQENLIHFAAFKKHIGIYPGDLSLLTFADRLKEYKHSKGAIQLPLDKPIDYKLIEDITKWRVKTVEEAHKLNDKIYEYEGEIMAADKGGAYVAFPFDVRQEFGKGRVKVHATFDGEPYDGSVVNMGIKNPDGSICYIIGIRKDIRGKIGKQVGDMVKVTIKERE
ncbi:uncharacterized protein YdhG (YjbR/CyaY superfamily) [Lachnospiraceae bacterium PF1-21]